MRSATATIFATVFLLALGSLFFRPVPPHASVVEAADNDKHPTEKFVADSTARTVVAAFAQANTPYYPEDRVTAFPEPSLGLGSVVTVVRATPIVIQDGKKTLTVRTWQETVGNLLDEKKIELGNEDRVAPSLDTALVPNLRITITRVARTQVSEFEAIAFQVVEQDDPSTYRGTRTVSQQGQNGKREKKYLLIREDGELISKTLLSNQIVEAVKNQIIKVGTKLKIGKILSGKATWYQNAYGTKVAMDAFKKGVEVRITNLSTGKSIIVRNDGCICGATGVLVDLAPEYFQALGGSLGQGVLASVRVEEILP
jgi:hypothetical protein